MQFKKLYLYLLSTLSVTASALIHAEVNVTVPTLPGMVTASIGTFYTAPSMDDLLYANQFSSNPLFPFTNGPINVQTDYNYGIEASLGYIFSNTANGIELSYRGVNSVSHNNLHNDVGVTPSNIPFPVGNTDAANKLTLDFNNADLMVNQVLQLGPCAHLRLLAGASYLHLKEQSITTYTNSAGNGFSGLNVNKSSKYDGFGPRLGMDARYELGHGFGFIAGASAAYLFGELDYQDNNTVPVGNGVTVFASNEIKHHTVMNLRGNLGVDYIYKFNSTSNSSMGVELGYQADTYNNPIVDICTGAAFPVPPQQPTSVAYLNSSIKKISTSFDGFYLNLKATF